MCSARSKPTDTLTLRWCAVLALAGGLSGVLAARLGAQPAGQLGTAQPATEAVRQFTDSRGQLGATFDYPDGWELTEEEGAIEPYHQVRLRVTDPAAARYVPFVAIRRIPLDAAQDAPAAATELLERSIQHLPYGAAVELRRLTEVAGMAAEELIVNATIPVLTHHGLNPADLPIRTRTVVLRRGAELYELVYSAEANAYSTHEDLFERILRTLQFTSP
jgi:hypothetical protein